MLIPLYAFLEGDTLGLVVLAQAQDSVARLADLVQRAACMRVAPRTGLRVWCRGKVLDPSMTLAQAGLAPLDPVDVRAAGDTP
jgi:hypothetical protein